MDDTYIEVPVTSQSLDVYYFQVTPEILKEAGVTKAEELVVLIQNEAIDPFDYYGEWENSDSEIQSVYYEDARIC